MWINGYICYKKTPFTAANISSLPIALNPFLDNIQKKRMHHTTVITKVKVATAPTLAQKHVA